MTRNKKKHIEVNLWSNSRIS